MDSKDMEYVTGGLLYILSGVLATLFVAPYLGFLVAYFAFAGVAAVSIVGGIVSLPVLVIVFAAFHHFGVKASIPEAE
jgi:hypothetical protein